VARRTYAAVALVCAAFLAGCSGNDDEASKQPTTKSSNDQMVDVGGRSLHLSCVGSGAPTVVLEAGLGGHESTWSDIVPAVKADSRVCTYARANIPPSDPRAGKHTAADSVADLRKALKAAGEKGPYVLVGFSFGGLITQIHAAEHPDEVVGLVLVESNHPDEVDQFEKHLTPEQISEDRISANANSEGVDVFASFQEAQRAGALPDVPLVVVTSTASGEWPPGWDPKLFNRLRAQQQRDLAASVPGGTQVMADRSGHDVPHEQPEIVVSAISTVLGAL
jgi:predicted alpha/beta hydrolase family esterase